MPIVGARGIGAMETPGDSDSWTSNDRGKLRENQTGSSLNHGRKTARNRNDIIRTTFRLSIGLVYGQLTRSAIHQLQWMAILG